MANGTSPSFVGRVSRLEVNATSGWCLATFTADDGDKEQVSIPDPRMQTLLETAMALSITVAITFNKGETDTLTSVVLDSGT